MAVSPPRRKQDLASTVEQELRTKIDAVLRSECIANVFAGTGRDLESLRLAEPDVLIEAVDPPKGVSPETFAQVIRASARILGDSRRFQDSRGAVPEPPAALRKYWEHVANLHGVNASALGETVGAAWKGTVREFLIQPKGLVLRPPGTRSGSVRSVAGGTLMLPAGSARSATRRSLERARRRRMRTSTTTRSERSRTTRSDSTARNSRVRPIVPRGRRDRRTSSRSSSTTRSLSSMASTCSASPPRWRPASTSAHSVAWSCRTCHRSGSTTSSASAVRVAAAIHSHSHLPFAATGRTTSTTSGTPTESPTKDRPSRISTCADTRSCPDRGAEALRLAFRAARIGPEHRPGHNTHGEFGTIDPWSGTVRQSTRPRWFRGEL